MRDRHESCRRTIAASSFRAWAANLIARKTTGKSCDYREREREARRRSTALPGNRVKASLEVFVGERRSPSQLHCLTLFLARIRHRHCLPRSISLPAEVTREWLQSSSRTNETRWIEGRRCKTMSNPRASSFAHLPPRPDIADDQNKILLALPRSWIKLRPHQPHRV